METQGQSTSNSGWKKTRGFSLVELMMVVGIIGILSAMAIPSFKNYQMRARQLEAKMQLNHIHTLQESYRASTGYYYNPPTGADSDLTYPAEGTGENYQAGGDPNNHANPLGFKISNPAKVSFWYTVQVAMVTGINHIAYAEEVIYPTIDGGTVRRVAPGCKIAAEADQWSINQDKILSHTYAETDKCY